MAARGKAGGKTPWLERIAAAAGLVLLFGLLGVIGWEALHGDPEEMPAIELRTGRIAPAAGGFVVEIHALNRSGGTAQSVEVEGVLTGGGAPVESSGFTFDYVPGHSRRSGGLFFRRDPRRHQLELRALGYQEP